MERKRTICDICCPSFHCGIDAYVKDGQLVKIEGTAEHPQNHGLLCAKGLAARQYVYRNSYDSGHIKILYGRSKHPGYCLRKKEVSL